MASVAINDTDTPGADYDLTEATKVKGSARRGRKQKELACTDSVKTKARQGNGPAALTSAPPPREGRA